LRIGLQELLRKARIEGDADFLKEGLRVLSRMLMEMEVEEHIGRVSLQDLYSKSRQEPTSRSNAVR
jgi:hypothetical protein